MLSSSPNYWRAWWPAVVWVGLISIESTDFFSSDHTGTFLYRLLAHFYAGINLYDVLTLNFYLRKTGHVVGYGMLALLLLRGWRMTIGPALANFSRAALLAWIGTVFVASMDEWHQSFIPSRTGTFHDVVLDSLAGLAFLWFAYRFTRRSATTAQLA